MNTNENAAPLSVPEAMEFIMADVTPQQAVGYAETLDDAREGARHATMQAATRWDELAYAAEVAWGVCVARGYPGATGLAAEDQAPTLKAVARELAPPQDPVRRWKHFSRLWESRCVRAFAERDLWQSRAEDNAGQRNIAQREARNWRETATALRSENSALKARLIAQGGNR